VKYPTLLLIVFPLLAACSTLSTSRAPATDFASLKRIHVEHRLADGRGLDELMARELQKLGYEASSGPLTLMPTKVDAIVAYEDRWTFDFTTYMIGFEVAVRDARTGRTLASGHYFHPSFSGNDPADVIARMLRALFPPHRAA
jgi:hypothetical protein